MSTSQGTVPDQSTLWNGPAGQAWVERQELLDRMFKPIEEALIGAVAGSGGRVLDVGCGTGAVSLAAARLPGVDGRCVGVDISEPMLAAARARAAREGLAARFIHADAQTYGFEAEGFDWIISRFGVMFFDDPVRAFANLRRAAAGDARLCVAAWRGAADNPFMTTAERAAAPLLPQLPARRPDGPGQFAFADRGRVETILADSGWSDVDIRPVDFACTLPKAELTPYLTRLGPLGLALNGVDDATRRRVIDTVLAAFEPYVDGDQVRFTAACWMVRARAGS